MQKIIIEIVPKTTSFSQILPKSINRIQENDFAKLLIIFDTSLILIDFLFFLGGSCNLLIDSLLNILIQSNSHYLFVMALIVSPSH
mgnify:CR=1 FL=1